MMGSVADRQQALRAAMPVWEPRTLHAVLDDTVRATPDRPFVITDDRSWSYAEIAAWSKRLAAGLVALGVASGEKVALVLANYPEFVAIRYAVSRIGAVCVPINILNRCDELRYLLDQSDSVLLVTMDRFRGVDYLDMLDEIAPGWEDSGGGQGLPNLRHVAVLPTGEAPDRSAARTLFSLEAGDGWAEITVDPHAVCDIIYTSGTTGPPKGVLLTHDMLMRTAYGSAYARAFEDGRRILFSLPMYHVFGYVEGLLAVPFVGGAIVPQLRFDAIATLEAIARHHATDALLIPAMSLAILDAAGEGTYDLSRWHAVLASGGRAPERLWQGLREGLGVDEITTGYGMTETTASTTVTRPDDPVERLLTTNGRQRDVGVAGDPQQGGRLVTYRVVDPGTGAVLDDGEAGELVASGYGVTQGYYNKPEATAAAFDAEGWLRTGDLGRIDDDGYITLLGRTKESYRCGGEQVLPTEIEDLLTTHADVMQAHVVPIPDERMGEVGVAFVVARPGATLDRSALQTLIAARLARYKVPRHILLVDAAAIPTTASGRARKFLLTEQALQILELP
ncbi:class I adenylate-forming enzyme family protein [Sphingomonas aerolata]|uniref:class I adenylate-forming enzyme family protein n=1 Tax=Sphingomonas aerolata TaxID=185951 RepID=UPI002FDFD0A3